MLNLGCVADAFVALSKTGRGRERECVCVRERERLLAFVAGLLRAGQLGNWGVSVFGFSVFLSLVLVCFFVHFSVSLLRR